MSAEDRPCILIVDDDEGLATVISLMLDRAGYDAQAVYSGATALDWLSERLPDAVILDLMMPDISGFALLRRLRAVEATRRLPVIVLTARLDDESQREIRKIGANGFLTKPVSRSVLIALVQQATRQRARV